MDEHRRGAVVIPLSTDVTCKERRSKGRVWVKECPERREEWSAYKNILRELRLQDENNFQKYFRMNTDVFDLEI